MIFTEAREIAQLGGRVRRHAWGERGEWVALSPVGLFKSVQTGEHEAFTPTDEESAATDWEEVLP